jgi:hypothetical protein
MKFVVKCWITGRVKLLSMALTIYCSQLNGGQGVITATGPISIICSELDNKEGQIKSYPPNCVEHCKRVVMLGYMP